MKFSEVLSDIEKLNWKDIAGDKNYPEVKIIKGEIFVGNRIMYSCDGDFWTKYKMDWVIESQ